MSIGNYIVRSFRNGADVVSKTQLVEDTGYVSVNESVAASGSTTIYVNIDVSALKHIFISTSVDDCVFDFDGTSPTLTIKSTVPYVWSEHCNLTNALNDDITQIVVTNPSSTTAADVDIRFLYTV